MNTREYSRVIESPVGPLTLKATDRALTAVLFERGKITPGQSLILEQAAMQLAEYFAGKRQSFDLPMHTHGTKFQQSVWNALARIPFGKTLTYGQIAKNMKKPLAVRAVGQAVGKNPLCVLLPCHRVLASTGIGGFSGGIKKKQWLLKHEGITAK